MKRLLFVSFALTVLAAFAWAKTSASRPSDAVRMAQLKRNRELVEKLVKGGLRLSEENDPLKRAGYCNGLAQSLAREIEQAAAKEDGARAVEMGQHLQVLLKQGVAGNLYTVAPDAPVPGSTRWKQLGEVGKGTMDVMGPLEKRLKQAAAADPGDMRQALEAVGSGRAEVEKALKKAKAGR
ncbi:MAG TPA: hypothetical protein VG013_21225 [Gemmataceae bacterium]|jgi:hypothetical protein|nr:hypothetical protein [Gemmataceae bacterium]